MVMNTMPFAQPSDAFSEGLVYRLRVRALSLADGSTRRLFDVATEELTLDCVFSEPSVDDAVGEADRAPSPACRFVNDPDGGTRDGLRVFAGSGGTPSSWTPPRRSRRSPPDSWRSPSRWVIYLDGKSVLGLVVEIDCASVLAVDVELVGVVAETLTRGRHNVRIERVGRPEVKNMMLAPKQFDRVNRDLEIRDLYNMEDAFHLAEGYQGAYRARLDANLAFWDGLDGKTDWPLDEAGADPAHRGDPRRLPGRRRPQLVRLNAGPSSRSRTRCF